MGTKLHWVDGPWPGKLAVAARPRGGDWLEDEIASWHGAGIDTVLSLLTPEEEQSLDLTDEASEVKARGMNFVQLPNRIARCQARKAKCRQFWNNSMTSSHRDGT